MGSARPQKPSTNKQRELQKPEHFNGNNTPAPKNSNPAHNTMLRTVAASVFAAPIHRGATASALYSTENPSIVEKAREAVGETRCFGSTPCATHHLALTHCAPLPCRPCDREGRRGFPGDRGCGQAVHAARRCRCLAPACHHSSCTARVGLGALLAPAWVLVRYLGCRPGLAPRQD